MVTLISMIFVLSFVFAAAWFGYDSRDTVCSEERVLALHGVTWTNDAA